MTKTLTEQWKDMDFTDEHLYYWRMPNGEVRIMNKLGACSYKLCYDGGEIHILAFVPSYDEFKQLVSNSDELVQKIHILNEQNTKHYNELCEEIKKNNILKKKLEIATKALQYYADGTLGSSVARQALKEMEGVK